MKIFSAICGIIGIVLFNVVILAQKHEIKILEAEKTILIENYLSNMPKYRKPLWSSEEEKQDFIKWLKESAERGI